MRRIVLGLTVATQARPKPEDLFMSTATEQIEKLANTEYLSLIHI